jgi:hypothetical protein
VARAPWPKERYPTSAELEGHGFGLALCIDLVARGTFGHVAKSRLAEPSWRGLPVDNIAAETLAKEARSRAAEEQRLAKRAGEETAQPAIDVLKRSLRTPAATGNAGLMAFLGARAGR